MYALRWLGGLFFSFVIATSAPRAGDKNLFDNRPTGAKCRVCHDNPRDFAVFQISNPDRHHRLIGQPVPRRSMAPNPTAAPTYGCLTCHTVVQNPSDGTGFAPFRDCLSCHAVTTVTGSPGSNNLHHQIPFRDQHNSCKLCHDTFRRIVFGRK